ncbi:MAG: hypothetical protein ACRCX8_12245 [Sarcina sp.]
MIPLILIKGLVVYKIKDNFLIIWVTIKINDSDIGTGTNFKRAGFQSMMYDAGLNVKKLSSLWLKMKYLKFQKELKGEIKHLYLEIGL